MTVDVRPAQLTDIPDIVECYLRSWRAAYANDLNVTKLDEEAEKRRVFDWLRGITSDTVSVFVAIDAEGTAGVLQADLRLAPPRDLPEVTMLYVDPRAWGTELARTLLATGADWIGQQGYEEARLRVVETHRRARRFYEREGWTVDDEIEPAANDFFRLVYYRRDLRRQPNR